MRHHPIAALRPALHLEGVICHGCCDGSSAYLRSEVVGRSAPGCDTFRRAATGSSHVQAGDRSSRPPSSGSQGRRSDPDVAPRRSRYQMGRGTPAPLNSGPSQIRRSTGNSRVVTRLACKPSNRKRAGWRGPHAGRAHAALSRWGHPAGISAPRWSLDAVIGELLAQSCRRVDDGGAQGLAALGIDPVLRHGD
jgi:hypothetical protein